MATERQATGRIPAGRSPTAAAVHNLYVKFVPLSGSDAKSRAFTLYILKYILARKPILTKMGITVRVSKITEQQAKDARLIAAMRSKKITALPALTSSNDVYVGKNQIIDVYERNIKEFVASGRREETKVEGLAREDDVSAYMQDEMTFARAEQDQKERGIGESEDDMMSSYQTMMQRREELSAKRRPARPPPSDSEPREAPPGRGRGGRAPAPAARPGQSSRPDNVGGAAAGDEDEIQSIINQMSRDIDPNTVTAAFSGGGGDSLDGGEESGNAQDDIMVQSYWQNQESSL